MNKITPFLWLNDSAEDTAEFYLSVFPDAKKVGELRSSGVGPWPAGKIATITIDLMGQNMTFLNGGPAHALTPAFSYSIACKDQAEIDRYRDKLVDGGKQAYGLRLVDGQVRPLLADRAGRHWQHPKESQSDGCDDEHGEIRHRDAKGSREGVVSADCLSRRSSRGRVRGGASSASTKAFHWAALRPKVRRCSSASSARARALSRTNSLTE